MADVSEAMHRRISAHLDAGVTRNIRGKRAMLNDVVLNKANGDCYEGYWLNDKREGST